MTTTAPILPTPFSPPSSCFNQTYWSVASLTLGNFHLGDPNNLDACVPSASGTSTVPYFSASSCPNGYTTACAGTLPAPFAQSTAICCPPGNFSCQGIVIDCISAFDVSTSFLATVIPTAGTRYVDTFSASNSGAILAPSVQLRWGIGQATSVTGGSGSAGSAESASGRSNAAQPWEIAVGVILGVVVLAAIGFGGWLVGRRTRSAKIVQQVEPSTGSGNALPPASTPGGGLMDKHELLGHGIQTSVMELEGVGLPAPSELQAVTRSGHLAELPTTTR